MISLIQHLKICKSSAQFGSTYANIGRIQRRSVWPRKDDTPIRKAFCTFSIKKKKNMQSNAACCLWIPTYGIIVLKFARF